MGFWAGGKKEGGGVKTKVDEGYKKLYIGLISMAEWWNCATDMFARLPTIWTKPEKENEIFLMSLSRGVQIV